VIIEDVFWKETEGEDKDLNKGIFFEKEKECVII